MSARDGGAAFPTHPILYSSADAANAQGMTLRDWFAGQALAGLLADHNVVDTPEKIAGGAYRCADAMLAARNEAEPQKRPHLPVHCATGEELA